MISHLNGTVAHISADGAVIDVGGAGLRVQCTPGTLVSLRPGQPAHVPTSLVVREDALTLYGFASADERDMFELVQTASGVGPKLALAMLAVLSPDALRDAVAREDVTALTRVPGIGRKGAQRIILELAGRLGEAGGVPGPGLPGGAGPDGAGRVPGGAPWRDQVRAGLVNLGWPAREAEQAIAAVEADMARAAAGGGTDAASGDGSAAVPAGSDGSAAVPAGGDLAGVEVATALRAALRKLSRA